MRYLIMVIVAATMVGCATQRVTTEAAAARRHAANIAAAEDADYRILSRNGHTVFCPARAPLGSHIAVCLTENQWEQEQMGAFTWKVFNAPTPYTVISRESY
jgi:hypothetical protein